jgi:hypothetical protein
MSLWKCREWEEKTPGSTWRGFAGDRLVLESMPGEFEPFSSLVDKCLGDDTITLVISPEGYHFHPCPNPAPLTPR